MDQKLQSPRGVTLYNVMFPVWMLWLFPLTWLVILPANFIIDLLVVVLTLKALQLEEIKQVAGSVILPVWLLGFAADFIGTALMFGVCMLDFGSSPFARWWYLNITSPVSMNPFGSVFAVLLIAICVAVTGLCIYWFNRKLSLRKAALSEAHKHKLALSLAIFTAPYLFYLPTQWFYR